MAIMADFAAHAARLPTRQQSLPAPRGEIIPSVPIPSVPIPSGVILPSVPLNLPHDDLGPRLNTVFWLLTTLALAFMSLRLYCKITRSRHLWWDDYVLIVAWIALAVSASTTSVCVALGYGKHNWDMRPEDLPKMPFVAVFAGFFSVMAASLSKTSFALTLLRLSQPWMKVALWFIMVTLNGIMGTAMIFMWTKCKPVALIWDYSLEGECIPPEKVILLYQWSAGWSGSMDVILALFPWAILWNLRTMTKREKLGIAIAMSMGFTAAVASFVKMFMLPRLTGDPTESVAVTIWGGAEGAITIIAASIPVLRALIVGGRGGKKPAPPPAKLCTTDERRLNEEISFETLELSPMSPAFGKMMLGQDRRGSSATGRYSMPRQVHLSV